MRLKSFTRYEELAETILLPFVFASVFFIGAFLWNIIMLF